MFTQNSVASKEKEQTVQSSGCIACLDRLSFLGKNAAYEYSTCNKCMTVQISPIPDQHDIELAYTSSQFATHIHGQGDPSAINQSSRPHYISIADTLSDHNISGLVVDYGAGWGGLCKVLIERGFK
jgi:hypothetical protein